MSEAARKNYTGLELDADAVNFAVSYFNSNAFLNESLEEFESDRVFDVVFAFEVLEHFDNPIENIRKISRFLKDDGVFIGTSPYPYAKNIFADKTHNFVLHPENWKQLFLKNGFKKVDIYPMSFFPVVWRFNKHLHVRIPFYVPFPYFISTSLIIGRR